MDTSVLTIIVTFGVFLFAQLSFFVLIVKMIVKPIETDLNNHITETNNKIDSLSQRVDGMHNRFDDINKRFEPVNARLDRLYEYLLKEKGN